MLGKHLVHKFRQAGSISLMLHNQTISNLNLILMGGEKIVRHFDFSLPSGWLSLMYEGLVVMMLAY